MRHTARISVVLGLLGLLAVHSPPTASPAEGPHVVRASAGCGWPGDTVHYYRGPRAQRPRTSEEEASAPTLDPSDLRAGVDAFGDRRPDLAGTWARLVVTSTLSNAPFVGEIRSTSSTIQRLVMAQSADAVDIEVEVCHIELESSGPVQTTVPEAFVRGIGVTQRHGEVRQSDGAWRFHQDRYVRLLGARLADPANDPLPTEASDPAVVDQDEDGHPGMTVVVQGFVSGDVYTVQRVLRELDGVVRDPNTIDGYVRWSVEQATLGASSFMLDVETDARVDPITERNYFLTTRVPDDADCAAIVQSRDRLFAR